MCALTSTGCSHRRHRMLHWMQAEQLDAVIISDVRDIYYFVGTLLPVDLPSLYLLRQDTCSELICPAGYTTSDVGSVIPYDWNLHGTRHPDLAARLLSAISGHWANKQWRRLGYQQGSLLALFKDQLLQPHTQELIAIDAQLALMQARKDPDEIRVIRKCIDANLGAYQAACDAIYPGANELEVLAAGIRGAMQIAGEKVQHDGDYQCGEYNGPARNHLIQDGELYIIDAWTCFRGYWSDMARTFVVGTEPSDMQLSLFEHIRSIHSQIPGILKPGVDGVEVFAALDELIREHPPLTDTGLIHHGGHAIGLRAHEMPDINRERGGRLEPGNVICIEPGGYFPAARYGVRLENMYLVTEEGSENLCKDTIEFHVCGK